ncbi:MULTISPECIES: sensor domain-containing protein [unclassified Mesorhizobium]|uniref:sensor domain-containing protein n=1 Tax=unclassified Mesorhizobium TaxID=325217 RepID=UPI001126D5DE|nr:MULTISPECIES: sensor domain-containing protein [unclassified Mesorhizobium]MBZ9703246.1 hypothetical protein [Mesorhizobium sp. CO1-1-3]MBZ9947097.1 hypothetical protein [Mesorhizobium sp. BR1-1-11]TPJ06678.1 sensor domain-containing protein [Mesorhizobium sp. B2-8-1]
MPKPTPYLPSIDEVVRMAPELNAWAEMAARAFGLYEGINEAIKMARDKDGSVAHYADEIRQQMILMALIRSFALMDRGSKVSLQSAYQFLLMPDSFQLIARRYADSEPKSSFYGAMPVCQSAISRFLEAYRSVDFAGFQRIQSFRNSGIAHVSWPDAEKAKVTFSDVEKLVLGCCEMAGQLTLMTSARNDWPIEHLEEARSTSYRLWLATITAQSNGMLDL